MAIANCNDTQYFEMDESALLHCYIVTILYRLHENTNVVYGVVFKQQITCDKKISEQSYRCLISAMLRDTCTRHVKEYCIQSYTSHILQID